MKQLLCVLALLVPTTVSAQILSPSPQSISAVFSSACTSSTCATWVLGQASSITLGITGTFSGTITFYGSADGGQTYVATGATKLSDGTLTTTTTATGQFAIANAGFTQVQARFTAYTSGGANITASRGYATAKLVPFSSGSPVPASSGGTGISSYTIGDMLYASGATTLSKLAASTSGFVLTANGVGVAPSWQAISGGDVVGPASSTDNAIVRFDGATGKLIQDYTSGAPTIGDTGAVTLQSTFTLVDLVASRRSSTVLGFATGTPGSFGLSYLDSGGSTYRSIVSVVGNNQTFGEGSAGTTTINGVSIDFAAAATSTTSITVPTLYGSAAANGDLSIEGTSSATKTTSAVNVQAGGGQTNIGSGTYLATIFNYVTAGTTPSVADVGAASCGTTAATIAGNNNAGIVTVGATSGTQCRVTFTVTAPTRWQCIVNNETTANLARTTSVSNTQMDFLGTFVGGDVISYVCSPR